MSVVQYKQVGKDLIKVKDRNHIYNNLEEFMDNVLSFMYYVDLIHFFEDKIKLEKIEETRLSILNEFNEISPWGMDHVDIVLEDTKLYQRGYYIPSFDNEYPLFDETWSSSYKYYKTRLHAMNEGIQIWNSEIEENEERQEYISYSLWKYLEEVKQGDLIEYRGYYMQVKHFTKQQ